MSESGLPSSGHVVACLAAFQLSSALKAAIELDLFAAIADGQRTVETLAARCKADARGVRILANYLVINGFLTKQGDQFDLTAESRCYLDPRSPEYLGDPVTFVQAPFVWAQFGRLTEWVRQGGARSQANALDPNHEMWVTFARVMARQMTGVAQTVIPVLRNCLHLRERGPLKILDVAAGHGMFGITFAKEDPTCHVVALDWPRILEVTREHAVAHGVADRFTMVGGDILQAEIGDGYDVVLIPNLIHQLDRESNVRMLKKVRAAMKPGGIVGIVEFAPNDDRVSPHFAGFALFVLATTPGGDAYTVSEIRDMLGEAGFGRWCAWEMDIERLFVGVNDCGGGEQGGCGLREGGG